MDLEHEQRLTAVEERSKSNTKRIDKLEESTEAISRLATSMEVMANKQEQVADTVDKLDGEFIEKYVSTGSPMDKAGAYGLQDAAFGEKVTSVNGDADNVIGLPVAMIEGILKENFNG